MPHDILELLPRPGDIAGQIERGAELVVQRSTELRVLVRQLDALAEKAGGRFPVADLERADAAKLVRQPALEEQVELLLQRIGHENIAIAPLTKVRLRLVELAEPAIGRRERRVQALGFGIDRQRVLEVLHRLRVVAFGDGDTSETGQHRHRSRREAERPGEQWLGGLGPALVEVQPAEPDERRQIVGLQLEHPLERRFGLVGFAAALVEAGRDSRASGFRRAPVSAR